MTTTAVVDIDIRVTNRAAYWCAVALSRLMMRYGWRWCGRVMRKAGWVAGHKVTVEEDQS